MAIKKSKSMNASDIMEVAQKFYEAKCIADEQAKIVKEASELLKLYAAEHPEEWDGNAMRFGAHVRVERRAKLKCDYDTEKLDDEWLIDFLRYGGGEYVSVSFDVDAIGTMDNPHLQERMAYLAYDVHEEETLAVYKQK